MIEAFPITTIHRLQHFLCLLEVLIAKNNTTRYLIPVNTDTDFVKYILFPFNTHRILRYSDWPPHSKILCRGGGSVTEFSFLFYRGSQNFSPYKNQLCLTYELLQLYHQWNFQLYGLLARLVERSSHPKSKVEIQISLVFL